MLGVALSRPIAGSEELQRNVEGLVRLREQVGAVLLSLVVETFVLRHLLQD